jgi:hypothetical protein
MDTLQLYSSYTVLSIVASSVAIVFLSFSTGSTSRQLALIGELKTSVDRARKTCERARSAALWSAGGADQFVGMSNLLSFPPESHESKFVVEANRLIEALASVTADTGDLRVSALLRRVAEVRRIEAECHTLLAALDGNEEPDSIHAALGAHPAGRFQRLAIA